MPQQIGHFSYSISNNLYLRHKNVASSEKNWILFLHFFSGYFASHTFLVSASFFSSLERKCKRKKWSWDVNTSHETWMWPKKLLLLLSFNLFFVFTHERWLERPVEHFVLVFSSLAVCWLSHIEFCPFTRV